MNRADRMLRLIQVLRRHRSPVTADRLARELEVSVRTVYRDVATLMASRVPVRGEAGIGYVLEEGYDLPPMMLTADEVEAVLIGMRWLRERADPVLARAADDVVAKVGAILPAALKPVLFDATLLAPAMDRPIVVETIDVAPVRRAIREGRALHIAYLDEGGSRSQRRIWPFGLAYFETVRVVLAWCEMRGDFRHFRTDRIESFSEDGPYPARRAELMRRWKTSVPDLAGSRGSDDGG